MDASAAPLLALKSTKMLIGLVSKIGGGKDTVAPMVQELYPEINW